MNIKKILCAVSALCIMSSAAFSVSAEPNDDSVYQSESTASSAEEEQTPQESESQTVTEAPNDISSEDTTETTPTETETVTTTTTSYPGINTVDTPTLQPTKVELEVGEVQDQRFEVALNISPETSIAGATINVEYDSELLELRNSVINEDAIGGIPVDSYVDGKYTFTYMNTQGTNYSGTYSTLTFRIKDNTMTSTVIYVSVESLEDTNLLPVSNIIKNGILSNREAVVPEETPDPSEYINIVAVYSEQPIALEALGIRDVKDVTVTNGQIALVENGQLTTLAAGETDLIVTHNDDTKSYYKLKIAEPATETVTTTTAAKKTVEKQDTHKNNMSLWIIVAVIAAIAAVIIEYIVIVKPFDKLKKTVPTVYRQDDDEEEDYEADGSTDAEEDQTQEQQSDEITLAQTPDEVFDDEDK